MSTISESDNGPLICIDGSADGRHLSFTTYIKNVLKTKLANKITDMCPETVYIFFFFFFFFLMN